jgi:AraC-like DNA-binding protein
MRLPKGGEWLPQFPGWCLAQTGAGVSYWQEESGAREISAGSTLVFCAEAKGLLRASQLNEVSVIHFRVDTGRLLGLLTLREQHFLTENAARKTGAVRVYAPESSISGRLKNLRVNAGASASSTRLRLLQLFMDAFELEIDQDTAPNGPWMDGRGRLRQMLNQMPASDFVELSVSDLAPMLSCSPRHLNRLFREELGSSFREKQIELRLARACELLSTSNSKVVDVALESGYQSSSVFSELFKKHFGVSPGQWRRQRLKAEAGPRIQF